MLTKEAIEKMQEALAIEQVASAVLEATRNSQTLPVAVPDSMTMHDLQKYMPNRRRLAGEMHTTNPDHFADYAKNHAEEAALFVDAKKMTATGVLNFGNTQTPGHADNLVTLQFVESAPYKALLRCTGCGNVSQRAMAEWLEDNLPYIHCLHGEEEIKPAIAIAAIRNVTIEQLQKVDSTVESLSQERTAFEQVRATSKHTMPTTVHFTCRPYLGLSECTFACRFGIRAGDDGTLIALRITNHEQHCQDMAEEAVELLTDKLGSSCPLYVGSYQKA